MKIRLITIGKLQEAWLRDAQKEYAKRLSRFTELEIIELAEASERLPLSKQLEQEAESMLKKLAPQDFLVALDLAGEILDSVELSRKLTQWFELGGAKVVFAIAGSNGYSDAVLARANFRLSMGKMTFPHQMARIMILEQLFRSFKIAKGETYHK